MAVAVVFGATGFAGGAIASELVARGHRVTGVARDVFRLDANGVQPREGSMIDLPFFTEVTAGADMVVLATHALIDGQVKVADRISDLLAALGSRPTRLGVVGGAGSLRVSEGGPRFMDVEEFPAFARPEASAQAELHEALRTSSTTVDWFYLSPPPGFGAHVGGERTGTYRAARGDLMLTLHGSPTSISSGDFADALVDELEQPTVHRGRFTVGY